MPSSPGVGIFGHDGSDWTCPAKTVPPARDNQNAADFLCNSIGTADPFVQWVAVRPDSLLEGDVSEYVLHEGLVSSLTRPDSTNMAYVAHFICGLVVNPNAWNEWKGRLPVIINAARSDR